MITSFRWSAAFLALVLGGAGACLFHAFGSRTRGEAQLRLGAQQIADSERRVASLARFTDEAVRSAQERAAAPRASFAFNRAGLLKTLPKNWVDLCPGKDPEGRISVGCTGIPARDWDILLSDLRLISGQVPQSPIALKVSEEVGAMNEPQLVAKVFLGEPIP